MASIGEIFAVVSLVFDPQLAQVSQSYQTFDSKKSCESVLEEQHGRIAKIVEINPGTKTYVTKNFMGNDLFYTCVPLLVSQLDTQKPGQPSISEDLHTLGERLKLVLRNNDELKDVNAQLSSKVKYLDQELPKWRDKSGEYRRQLEEAKVKQKEAEDLAASLTGTLDVTRASRRQIARKYGKRIRELEAALQNAKAANEKDKSILKQLRKSQSNLMQTVSELKSEKNNCSNSDNSQIKLELDACSAALAAMTGIQPMDFAPKKTVGSEGKQPPKYGEKSVIYLGNKKMTLVDVIIEGTDLFGHPNNEKKNNVVIYSYGSGIPLKQHERLDFNLYDPKRWLSGVKMLQLDLSNPLDVVMSGARGQVSKSTMKSSERALRRAGMGEKLLKVTGNFDVYSNQLKLFFRASKVEIVE